MTITTLEGLDDGTDLAVTIHGSTQRWTLRDGKVASPDGRLLDPWFLSGLMADGKIMLGDFAPPEVGDWFSQGERYMYLVVNLANQDTDNRLCDVAIFRREAFYSLSQERYLVTSDQYKRAEAPEWATPQLVSMTTLYWKVKQELEQSADQMRKIRQARDYLTYATDYLKQATRSLQ